MEPVAVLSTSTNDLNLMRAVTESQCGEMRSSATWAVLGSMITRRAAAY